MLNDLKTLNKPERMKLAEKHLGKYISELKRHFDFSDDFILFVKESNQELPYLALNIKDIDSFR